MVPNICFSAKNLFGKTSKGGSFEHKHNCKQYLGKIFERSGGHKTIEKADVNQTIHHTY